MSLKSMGFKVYVDPYGFGESAIRLTREKNYVNAGKAELIEYRKNKVYDGGYVKFDTIRNTMYACIYKHNNLIGPRLNVSKGKFEYANSDGDNAYLGFRIEYKKGEYRIGYYKDGQFSGKLIILNGKNITFAKASKYDAIIEKKQCEFKFCELNYHENPDTRKLYYEGDNHTGSTSGIVYEYGPDRPLQLHSRGIMRCPYYHNILYTTHLEDVNSVDNCGFGKYHMNDDAMFLGYVNRNGIKGNQILGFSGPCIYKQDNNHYILGYFKNDLPNDLCIACDLKSNTNTLAMYKNGKRNGFSFDMNNENLQISIFLNGAIVTSTLVINSNMDAAIFINKNQISSQQFPFDVKDDEVEEELENNESHDFKKAIKNLSKKIEEKFNVFEYEVEYEKVVKKDNIIDAKAKVKILKLKQPVYELVIPEETYDIAKDAFDYLDQELLNKTRKIYIRSNHIKEIKEGMYSKLKNLCYIAIISNSAIKICKNAFYGNEFYDLSFDKEIHYIEKGALVNCNGLKNIYVHFNCKVEEGAVPAGCNVIYQGAYFDHEKKIQDEKNQDVAHVLKEREKQAKKKERKQKLDNALYDISSFFKNIFKRRKDDDSFIKGSSKKGFGLSNLFNGNILSAIGTFFYYIFAIIFFIPGVIIKTIISLFKPDDDFEGGNIASIAIIILGVAFLILGFCDVLLPIHDGFSNLVNEGIPSLFGFRLTKAYSNLITHVKVDLGNGFLSFILTLLYAIVAPFNLLLNGGVLILVLIGYILFILYGLLFIYGLGAFLILLSIIIMIKSSSKGLPIVSLIVSIGICIIYYLMFTQFYPV